MGLVNTLTTVLEIPHEPGETVTIRRLGWAVLKKAADVRAREGRAVVREMGGEVFEAVDRINRSIKKADAIRELMAAEREAAVTSALSYDRETVLTAGVVGWSYAAPVTPEAIAALDERTAAWLTQAIVSASVTTPADAKNA